MYQKNSDNEIGLKIKFLRKQKKLTQEELAKQINVSNTTLSNYEVGYSKPDNDTLKKIALFFGISTDFLLGITSLTNPKKHIEELLIQNEITETEYDLLFKSIFDTNSIDLTLLNTNKKNMKKLKNIYSEIINIYLNYLDSIDNNSDDFEKQIKNIDNKFIEMLKSIDKNKVINKVKSNAFLIADIPQKFPILGKISAGLPILATENIEGYSYAPSSKINEDNDYFFLRVQGDSMNKKYSEGSLVFVQKQDTLENGDIGVVMINDEATIKKYRQENNFIFLEPMSYNPIHKEQTYDLKKVNIHIIGKVILSVNYE